MSFKAFEDRQSSFRPQAGLGPSVVFPFPSARKESRTTPIIDDSTNDLLPAAVTSRMSSATSTSTERALERFIPQPAPQKYRTVAVMPAYNAAATLRHTVGDIPPGAVDEVILVDDCSRDDTGAVARDLGLTVIVHERNTGYGGNQKTCYRLALEAGGRLRRDDPPRLPV